MSPDVSLTKAQQLLIQLRHTSDLRLPQQDTHTHTQMMTLNTAALEGPLKLTGALLQAWLEAAGDILHLISRSTRVQHITCRKSLSSSLSSLPVVVKNEGIK